MEYTTPIRVLSKAGLKRTAEADVSDLDKQANTYYVEQKNIVQTGLLKTTNNRVEELNPTSWGINSFTVAGLTNSDKIQYCYSDLTADDIVNAIADAEDEIKTKLTGYDASPTQT